MCQCKGHGHGPGHGHPHGHGPQGGCGCGQQGGEFKRHYFSKEEQLGKLEKYLNDLKKEVQAIEELIKEVKGA